MDQQQQYHPFKQTADEVTDVTGQIVTLDSAVVKAQTCLVRMEVSFLM